MGMCIESFVDCVLTAKVSGQLTPSEWQAAQAEAVARMRRSPGKASVLVVAEQFAGWSRGTWDDSPFQPRFNEQVDAMAIVGEPQWADLALMFVGKGLRQMRIEYFPTSDVARAR